MGSCFPENEKVPMGCPPRTGVELGEAHSGQLLVGRDLKPLDPQPQIVLPTDKP